MRHTHNFTSFFRHGHEHGHGGGRFARPERHRHPSDLDHGRHGLRRLFAHGDLRLVILHLIAEKPRHGYEIIKAIEEWVGGGYSPSPGVIYPTLTLLEDLGYATVSPSEDGAKKQYQITGQGNSFLDANRPTLDALLSRLNAIGKAESGEPPVKIARAIKRLKLALAQLLASGTLSDAQLDTAAAAIEAAAQTLENAR
jgi:DNA-binding PadR family transcriptional regulator